MKTNFFVQRKFLSSILKISFAVLVGSFVAKIPIDYFEFFLFDLRTKYRPAPADTNKITLIYVNQSTVERFQGIPSFDLHRDALDYLIEQKPSDIIYVSNLKSWRGEQVEKERFAETTNTFENIFFPTDELELKGEIGKSQFEPPLHNLKVVPGPKTQDNSRFAKDGVTRRLVLTFQDQPLLHPIIASKFNQTISDIKNVRGQFEWYGTQQAFIDFNPLNSFPTYSFEDAVEGKIPQEAIKGKIVIIGDNTGLEKRDYLNTPLTRGSSLMSLGELHANIFETLIRNSAPIRAPDGLNVFFTILISILTVHVVLALKPLKGILILLGTAFGFSVFSYFAFWPFGIWIDMAHPFLAIFLCYYFFIPYRLIMENRRSWEYYQKHKLLSEVELLKTNFIGMMSHDLKTPLARIQGMTELISTDHTPLSPPQREALDTIKQSSEDLLKFISTILNYAKIESQGVELHLQAKDINQVLTEVVRKHDFLAKLKHIQLILELDPLFSIQVDPELIKQVFSNLIENAIKYSPENSKVLISSEESDGKVVVQIADQGVGIPADELPNVFMKFFRSKHAKLSPIKGSGLGLYLAKYFVELHQGTISVESDTSQGSTFTVELPIKA
ncbi:MAG: ATP-binding protein [Pseudobdellovibrionaceae bacterium]